METGISSGLMGHLARMQTFPYLPLRFRVAVVCEAHVYMYFVVFSSGHKDIVLELLSTMTKARDVAFVDKVGRCIKIVVKK